MSLSVGEPLSSEWIGDICVEEHTGAVRIVQPRDGQVAPESVIIPDTSIETVIGLLEEYK